MAENNPAPRPMGMQSEAERQLRIQMRLRQYKGLNEVAVKGQTVLTGSSLMEGFPVNELMMNKGIPGIVYNRGFGGYTTDTLLEVLDEYVLTLEPSKLIINIGTNDMGAPGDWLGNLIVNYRETIRRVRAKVPDCEITMLAYYPTRRGIDAQPQMPDREHRTLALIARANAAVKALAEELGCRFVDLNYLISDADGYLREEYANDFIHMRPAGYNALIDELKKYF